MRRLALAAAAAAIACGNPTVQREAGPLDRFFYPVGVAVLDHRLIVASSDADLTYSPDDGGSVIAVDPTAEPIPVTGAVNVLPFAGEIGLADLAACPAALVTAGSSALALVPIRGADLVYRLDVGTDGALSCEDCQIHVGSAERGDPFAMGIACDSPTTPGVTPVARAYVGYLRSSLGQAWLTQIDLTRPPTDEQYVQHAFWDAGQIRSFAYDASRRRLYVTRSATGSSTSLRYVDLANECRIDRLPIEGGCRSDTTRAGAVPPGVELRGIALSNETDPASPVRRAYVTARIYDAAAAATAGFAVGDFDGLLLVVDLSEDAAGKLRFDVVDKIPIGYGAAYVHVLPARPGKRDVVAAIAANDGVVWIYDDDTGTRVAIGRDPVTGAPLVGGGPFDIAADPVPLPGSITVAAPNGVARVYVGSFRQHFVTPIDVPLDDPESAAIPLTLGVPVRIAGGVLQ